MPCLTKGCAHQSRDHSRSKKQPDGSWNGRCMFEGCECQLYRKPKSEEELRYENISQPVLDINGNDPSCPSCMMNLRPEDMTNYKQFVLINKKLERVCFYCYIKKVSEWGLFINHEYLQNTKHVELINEIKKWIDEVQRCPGYVHKIPNSLMRLIGYDVIQIQNKRQDR